MADRDVSDRQRPPATVIVTHLLRPGMDVAFRRWQDEMDSAAASFDGFLGTDVTPPARGSRAWSVVYRFDSLDNLRRWLDSARRRDLVQRARTMFEAPPTQHILLEERGAEAVTVVVTHPPVPGRESEFLAWQQRIDDAETRFPGFRGTELHAPIPGVQDEWTILFTFDSQEHLDRWLESPERAALLAEGQAFKDFSVRPIPNPYGSWFPTGGEAGTPVPSWKTALSVLVGLYPLVVVLTLVIDAVWPGAPLWASLLIGNIASVSLLTWVVMPVVTRALRFWLEPAGPASSRVDAIGSAVSVGFLAAAAVVFWLVTTVVWSLP
ncbi:antibiotic biosynthesis monooxygenase [Prescottella agglutinans]|uniref:Antibiotic biosynthesis monooxygenase n=1 Tax=Prescottella agglutinans TaxID=1644129 RepID=A0A438BCW9_9NOCA|nr:antibiotic biosynthesis monooxygenase [Prescottella agglutinans]RVW08824.1 antibiotic biosynthesis monooxygenase [Prescottella agglutinans]